MEYKYRCNDCGYEWEEDKELKTPSCPLPLSYCGSPDVSVIETRGDDEEEWYSHVPYNEAEARAIANDPLW